MKKGTKKSLLRVALAFGCLVLLLCLNSPVQAESFFFSTGNPDGKMATASRPSSAGKIEIESADDFVLTQQNLDHQRHLHRSDTHGSITL